MGLLFCHKTKGEGNILNSMPKYFYCQKHGITNTLSKYFQWKYGCEPVSFFKPGRGQYILTWAAFKNGIDPEGQIVYNYENLGRQFQARYYQFFEKSSEVWDYSKLNRPFYDAKHKPLEIYPDLIPNGKKDIKYLFYGAYNRRRGKVLHKIEARHIQQDISDRELNYWINRSEYILSISFTDKNQFNDSARIIPALSKGAKVIAERCDEDDFNQKMEALGVKILTYKELRKL